MPTDGAEWFGSDQQEEVAMCSNLYFAYGSNLNLDDLRRWCEEKRNPHWSPDLLSNPVPAWLPDMKLAFDYESSSRGGGVLNVHEAPGQVVPGVIFKVAAEGWAMLDKKEGAPNCYQRKQWSALTADGTRIPVATYAVTGKRGDLVKPTEAYLEVVLQGYLAFDLDPHRLEAAAAAAGAAHCLDAGEGEEPQEPGPCDAFFLYGTLMRGERRFPAIQALDAYCIVLAQCPGTLFDLGDFPGMSLNRDAEELVTGELVRVGNVEKALADLDRIEGFRGFCVEGSLVERVLVTVDAGEDRLRQAWTYVIAGQPATARVIPSGNWRVSRNRWDSFTEQLVAAHARGDERALFQQVQDAQIFPPDPGAASGGDEDRPLLAALRNHTLSERKIAQSSGCRVAVP